MPNSVRQLLLREYYNAAANSSLMFSEFEHVLSELARADIEVVLLKGAALATTEYPDIALRPMGDIDLLVPPSNLKAAMGVVEAMAYEPVNPPMRRGLEHLFFYETNYRGGSRLLTQVELHWDLVGGDGSRYRPDIDWFWAQTTVIRIGSTSALILSPTAHLLHAAVHASLKHGGDANRLLWLYDLHLIIKQRHQDIDWHCFVEKAREFHWGPAVGDALDELGRIFSTPLPVWAHDALTADGDRATRHLMERTTISGRTRTLGAWNHLAVLGWKAKFHWLAAVVLPDPTYMRWRYKPKPRGIWPIYYLVRWVEIGVDAVKTLRR
jgi:hypothetical protein